MPIERPGIRETSTGAAKWIARLVVFSAAAWAVFLGLGFVLGTALRAVSGRQLWPMWWLAPMSALGFLVLIICATAIVDHILLRAGMSIGRLRAANENRPRKEKAAALADRGS